MQMRRLRFLLAPLLALPLAFAAACGSSGDRSPEASPAEEGAVFVSGDFGEVPVHPLADELGPKSNKNDVVAQSFRVRNLSREQLFTFYEERLDGWRQTSPPEPIGDAPDAASRAVWDRDGQRLIVTVSAAPTIDEPEASSEQPELQYSLSLGPIGAQPLTTP